MNLTRKQIQVFQNEILEWYRKNKRDLPWRHTRDPYNILLSEVMSQQTQIARVVPKYSDWLQAFPTLESLAQASIRDVLLHWSGLGYNRRALYLKKFAETVVEDFQGKIPQDEKELLKLPGIGKYTARAILCFAFDKQIAVVDTNIKKVILVKLLNKHNAPEEEIEAIAQQLLPKGKPARNATHSVAGGAYAWNQALMDYAGAMLKAHKIIIPKQSRFKDSDRYFRGQVLKYLLTSRKATQKELIQYFSEKQTPIDTNRLERVLQTLVKDRFISLTHTTASLL